MGKHVNDPLENRMFGVSMVQLKNDDCERGKRRIAMTRINGEFIRIEISSLYIYVGTFFRGCWFAAC